LYAQRQSRDQRRLDLLAIDPRTGASRTLLTEVSDTWVDLERDFRPLEDGSFLWGSARSGWRHIYHYDEAGKLIRQVSSGKWRIAWGGPAAGVNFSLIVGVDEVAGEVYFAASIESPIEQHLYRIAFRRDDAPHRITQGSGWWRPTMAEGQPTAFVGDYSDPETPPQVGLYGLDGRRLAWLTENRLDETHRFNRHLAYRPTAQYDTLSPENGVDLHHVLIRPAGFDPSRRYPVIVRVYGGPGVQTVRREWRPLVEQLLTQAGYVVFQLDNRGTANRDSAFEHAQHRDLGGVSARDQLAGLRYLRSLSFVDPHRIGMMGWSFGGYLTLRTMATAGAELRAGAAGAAPSDFLLYDTHYTERFLGHPDVNVSAYRDDALLPRVKELHGDLLLIHGLSDDNVILANFTALVAALQQQGTLFDLAVYPGQGHAFRGEKPLVHLWKTYLRFFERTLAPGSDQLP
jgi:dipeptidyl-peptidase-4